MAQARRDAKAEAERLAIREKERRASLIELDRTIHAIAESWANPHVVNAAMYKRLRDGINRARSAWKD